MNTLVLNKKEKLLIELIEKENNKTKEEKEIEKIEKAKIQKKEENTVKRESVKLVEQDLFKTFKSTFEREPFNNACINLQLASTRQEILNHVPESDIEYNWVNNNYERVFNKVKKIYENDEKAKKQIHQIILEKQIAEQQRQAEQDEKFENGVKIFFYILKWICIIIFAPIVLLFIFISMCAKGK